MQSRTKASLIALSLIAIISVAMASILVHRELPTSIRIKQAATMGVYDIDGSTDLTSFGFGDYFWNEGKWVPSGADEGENPSSIAYWVKNIDQMDFYAQFKFSYGGLTGVDFTIYVKREDQVSWTSYGFDGTGTDKFIYQQILTSPSLDPDHPLYHNLQWQFKVHVNEGAPFGTFNTLLQIDAVDTPTG